ncbi:MAG: hypothetical protein V4857_05275 [Pseudomonadota bacterium]
MNVLKHMEAIFVVSLGVALVAVNLPHGAAQTSVPAAYTASASTATPAPMAVVVVTAKRLTAEEKQQLSRAESTIASVRGRAADKG